MSARMWPKLLWIVLLPLLAQASDNDTITFASAVLGKNMQYLVVKPTNYEDRVAQGHRYPVVYLLHCAGCTDLLWCSSSYGDVDAAIDEFDLIAVAPYDGGWGGDYRWWLDSPKRAQSQLATYVVDELRPRIDSAYATLTGPANTALAGHSMGGFGSMHLLIEYPDVFGVAVPIKAGLDLSYPLNENWGSDFNLFDLLGSEPRDSVNWHKVNVLRNAHKLQGRDIALRIYYGLEDTWFAQENEQLHSLLGTLGVDHELFALQEDHFPVTPSLMRQTLQFIDTSFSRQQSAVMMQRRGAVSPSSQEHPTRSALSTGLYDLRGTRLEHEAGAAAQGVYVAEALRGAATIAAWSGMGLRQARD